MPAGKTDAASGLRILIAGGRYKRFEHVTETVRSLGHEVVGHEMDLSSIGRATTALKPDVAVVIVGESTDEALRMMTKSGPVAEKYPSRLFTADNIGSVDVTDAAFNSGAWFGDSSFTTSFAKLWGVG